MAQTNLRLCSFFLAVPVAVYLEDVRALLGLFQKLGTASAISPTSHLPTPKSYNTQGENGGVRRKGYGLRVAAYASSEELSVRCSHNSQLITSKG